MGVRPTRSAAAAKESMAEEEDLLCRGRKRVTPGTDVCGTRGATGTRPHCFSGLLASRSWSPATQEQEQQEQEEEEEEEGQEQEEKGQEEQEEHEQGEEEDLPGAETTAAGRCVRASRCVYQG